MDLSLVKDTDLTVEEDMDQISLTINGVQYYVSGEVRSTTSLLEYIRRGLDLRGTKYKCQGGRCGACIVSVIKGPGESVQSVNSCLVPILSCHKWEVTTIEGVGNCRDAYHPLQKTLAENNGTQCGYCSPGWVMAMYSLLKGKGKMTMHEIESSLGSNMCRCTGYRPILDAFKKFAKDAPISDFIDIEDLKICNKMGTGCKNGKCDEADWCLVTDNDVTPPSVLKIKLKDGKEWHRVEEIQDIFKIFQLNGEENCLMLHGNTAKGVISLEYPKYIIDISGTQALKGSVLDQNLVIGGGMTMSEMIDVFDDVSNKDYFGYLKKFKELLKYVANIPVRNKGTVAGNLMITHKSKTSMTDIFMMFETVGAEITILDNVGSSKTFSMSDFLEEDMKGKIVLSIALPPLSNEYKVVVYKVAGKAENAGTILNAGFLYKLALDGQVLESRIVFGLPKPLRAKNTERYLDQKNLFKNETLQGALNILKNEIIITDSPPALSAEYRKNVAVGLWYKGLLSLCPPNVLSSRYRSGSLVLRDERPISQGRQKYPTDSTMWPVNKAMPKCEALIQCAGEATYSEDIPSLPREVFAAFVLSTVALGKIENIDASNALKVPGVVAFYSAKDIPGVNSYTSGISPASLASLEIFCDRDVKYYNQPIGVIVAQTSYIAEMASKLVEVTYAGVKKPVLNVKDAKSDPNRAILFTEIKAKEVGNDNFKIIKGDISLHDQYHACMETLVCVSKPTEEGLEVYVPTQHIDAVQMNTSRALNIPCNKIDVYTRHVGGSFGYKLSRATQIAIACNLVVKKLNRPCRFIQSLKSNMTAIGKRMPCFAEYEIGVDKNGVIQYNNYNLYEDNGYIFNEPMTAFTLDCYNNCYTSTRWNYKIFNTTTDKPSNTWCRSPGTLECISLAELMMDRIAYELDIDSMQVRLANLDAATYGPIKDMIEKLKNDSQYAERRSAVDKYNNDNRWKKRGLRFACMIWNPYPLPNYYNVSLSVYSDDGTVTITHGGIEMGQGINTKAAQICAYLLKIDVNSVQIKATSSRNSPNNLMTGASLASGFVGVGVQRCCQELLQRLEPIKAEMDNPTWQDLIKKAAASGVNLQTHGFVNSKDNTEYHVHGVACAEVEIDLLTGESDVLRVDLLEDVGRSVNPDIDIGQIEGGFIMGLGYWTSEQIKYDEASGRVLTDSYNNYWIPQVKDIPRDFRVSFTEGSYTTDALMGAKATGEPSICLSVVVPIAIREAVVAARSESGISSKDYFKIDGPWNLEAIYTASSTRSEDFKFY